MPLPGDKHPCLAYMFPGSNSKFSEQCWEFFCTCSSIRTCRHTRALELLVTRIQEQGDNYLSYKAFKASFWYRMFRILADGKSDSLDVISFEQDQKTDPGFVRVSDKYGMEMLCYHGWESADAIRFRERFPNIDLPDGKTF